ncbi:MAG TPA: hypothetical protein VGJ07_06755 [Rugosimonospora sp.]
MLGEARRRPDVEWVLGDLVSVAWDHEFDLVVMTGHAFQVFLDDDRLRTALAAIRAALTDDAGSRSRPATRARAWERWTPGPLTASSPEIITIASAPGGPG